jgi:pimeloyl-ACP methyl ester carboxylesterase
MLTMDDGARMHFDVRGRGEPLILLHGLTGTRGDWVHVFDLEALEARYSVVTPDARGHGQSTDPGEAFGFRRCALDLLAILDELGIERARAVGMSLGAKTLLHVATMASDRVTSMVLVSPTPRFPETTRALFRAFAAAEHSEEERAEMRSKHVGGDRQIDALWHLPARFADDPDDMSFTPARLASIAARTLVVAGDRDPLYPLELACELRHAIPRSWLWVVPGGGHVPIFGDERKGFEQRALAFLDA